MVLGQDIYNFGHQVVIKKGTVLSDRQITRLQQYSILRVMVEDELVAGQLSQKFHRSSYSKRVQASDEFKKFQKDYDKEIHEFREILNDVIEKNDEIDVDSLYQSVITLLKDTGNSFNAFDMVQNLRHYDDSTYAHSINVGLLCNVFSTWLGFPEEDQKTITLAGVLHDIGKTKIPLNIIQKPGKLNNVEYNIIKMHPNLGYDILTEHRLNYHIKNAALMHHERCDGTGYPSGLKGRDIDYFAKILSIVDVYDAMTSPRVYRGPMCPFDVIDIFVQDGLQKYDSEFILVFLKRIADSYINERVRLSNGTEGTIIYVNRNSLASPVIMTDAGPLDLYKEKTIHIDEIL